MSLFSHFTSPRKNHAKLGVFVATILLVMNLFASVDSITILNGSECKQTGVCQYRMQFSSWFSINPSYPEDYDYYKNIKDPQNNWYSTNGTLLDCMSSSVCTAIASDHVDFNYTHPDSGDVVVNMQVEDYWGGDYAAATLYHSVELFTAPDPVFQSCITDTMNTNGYTNINQITTLSCNSVALTSIEGVELLTSLASLNIMGSSVSDLSPLLQTSSIHSLTILGSEFGVTEIVGDGAISFQQMLEGFIACHYYWMPYPCEGNCVAHFKDKCVNGTCFYDYLINEPLCDCNEDSTELSGLTCVDSSNITMDDIVAAEMVDIKNKNPFFGNIDSWEDFDTGIQHNVAILGGTATASVETYEGKFISWEYNNGVRAPIKIHFYAAKPGGVQGKLPLLVYTHGASGWATPELTNHLAAELNMFVIYYSGPGRGPLVLEDTNGDGEGDTLIPDGNGYYLKESFPAKWSAGTDHTNFGTLVRNDKFFDALPDPRGSWFWADAVAAMRAITFASFNDNIDITNVAMSGRSAGGIATLLASSVDDRIDVAVPFIASLTFEDVVSSQNSWINDLRECTFTVKPEDISSEWITFIDKITGKDALIAKNSVPTLFINGATDEFFSLKALNSTYDNMLQNSTSRYSIQYKRGHDWLTPQNDDPPGLLETIQMRLNSGTYHWLKSHLDYPFNSSLDDNRVSSIPDVPTVIVTGGIGSYQPQVTITNPFATVEPIVKFYYSNDQGLNYQEVNLVYINPPFDEPYYGLGINEYLNSNFNNSTSIYFADVVYDFGENSNDIKNYYRTFYLSSQPTVPITPSIRPWEGPSCHSLPFKF